MRDYSLEDATESTLLNLEVDRRDLLTLSTRNPALASAMPTAYDREFARLTYLFRRAGTAGVAQDLFRVVFKHRMQKCAER